MKRRGVAVATAYVLTIVAANWAVKNVGTPGPGGVRTLPVWPGVDAPSGVYLAGLAFTLRDFTQRWLGKTATVAAIAVGALLSYQLGVGKVAVASALAFAVSELVDFVIFTAVERRSLIGAVVLSNAAGLLVDSWLFLTVAFGSTAFMFGQVVGKAWMTGVAVVLLLAIRRTTARRAVAA